MYARTISSTKVTETNGISKKKSKFLFCPEHKKSIGFSILGTKIQAMRNPTIDEKSLDALPDTKAL